MKQIQFIEGKDESDFTLDSQLRWISDSLKNCRDRFDTVTVHLNRAVAEQ